MKVPACFYQRGTDYSKGSFHDYLRNTKFLNFLPGELARKVILGFRELKLFICLRDKSQSSTPDGDKLAMTSHCWWYRKKASNLQAEK